MKFRPGILTRTSNHATRKAANKPMNVLVESRKLNFRALKVCGEVKSLSLSLQAQSKTARQRRFVETVHDQEAQRNERHDRHSR